MPFRCLPSPLSGSGRLTGESTMTAPAEPMTVQRRGHDAHQSAHAVADQDRKRGAAGILGDRQHLVGPTFQWIGFAPAAVAVPAQVGRDDVVVL